MAENEIESEREGGRRRGSISFGEVSYFRAAPNRQYVNGFLNKYLMQQMNKQKRRKYT